MRVLWFSNRGILNSNISGSGSWLYSMSHNLTNHYDIEIVNITESSSIKNVTCDVLGNITEWTIPSSSLIDGLPSKEIISEIQNIVTKSKPDVIHIWGVENFWGLLFSRGYITGYTTLLEIQGLLFTCNEYYRNNLYWREFYRTQSFFKALYSFVYVYLQSIKFSRRLKHESEILSFFKNISYQSDWTHQKLKFKTDAIYYHSLRPIRPQFFSADKWTQDEKSKNILTIASAEPYKGLHVTIKAIALLAKNNPDIKLLVAGVSLRKFNRGYLQYINDLVNRLGVQNKIEFLGSLNADELLQKIYYSRCLVISSFVESYSAVFAEAMCLGIPTVVSYSGAMTEFARNDESALFYTPGDFYQCAEKIERLMTNPDFANKISYNSTLLSVKNNDKKVAENQMSIYNKILSL